MTIEVLLEFSSKRLLAMDITGDFTKVNVTGWARHCMHQTQHPEDTKKFTQEECTPEGQDINLKILERVYKVLDIQ